jgi:hypothetical protein
MSPGQHAWPTFPQVAPPSPTQPPFEHVKPELPLHDPPLAMQVRESWLQHPPPLQTLPSQQGWPWALLPHAAHWPLLQLKPLTVQKSAPPFTPPQHRWPAPPHWDGPPAL